MAGWSKVPLPTPPSDLSIPQAGVWPTAMREWVQRTFKARGYSVALAEELRQPKSCGSA